jgi:hypothetical protein
MPRTLPLTRPELDIMGTTGCQQPGCHDHLHDRGFWFQARCHPSAGLEAHYCDGVLALLCLRCHRLISSIAVAAGVSSS